MKTETYNIRGTRMNKMQFSEIVSYLEDKGLSIDAIFDTIADEKEFIYVSDGFVKGLLNENEIGEWHHYFKKLEDGNFEAGKLKFS